MNEIDIKNKTKMIPANLRYFFANIFSAKYFSVKLVFFKKFCKKFMV